MNRILSIICLHIIGTLCFAVMGQPKHFEAKKIIERGTYADAVDKHFFASLDSVLLNIHPEEYKFFHFYRIGVYKYDDIKYKRMLDSINDGSANDLKKIDYLYEKKMLHNNELEDNAVFNPSNKYIVYVSQTDMNITGLFVKGHFLYQLLNHYGLAKTTNRRMSYKKWAVAGEWFPQSWLLLYDAGNISVIHEFQRYFTLRYIDVIETNNPLKCMKKNRFNNNK